MEIWGTPWWVFILFISFWRVRWIFQTEKKHLIFRRNCFAVGSTKNGLSPHWLLWQMMRLIFSGNESNSLRDYNHLRQSWILFIFFPQEKHVNLLHIESRKSKRRSSEFEIFVDCDISREQLNDIFHLLKSHSNILSVNLPDNFTVKEDGKLKGENATQMIKCIIYVSDLMFILKAWKEKSNTVSSNCLQSDNKEDTKCNCSRC